jgi:two-component system cell cycle response regulator DivK
MADPEPAARILVVDDYDDAREMYAEMLSFAGFVVGTARDGAEAIDMATTMDFDLIVLDIALPKVHGITVIRTLRARHETRTTPIITLSASVGPGVHKTVIEAGGNLALDKPCLPDELEAAVRKYLPRTVRGAG